MEKILSIIIPSYNSKPFLAKCLDSLLCECTDRLDIIVVNDGSTDGCEQIAEEYIAKYPASISLINKVNGGHGSGINVGSEKAVGKYLKVLDADDWFLTENIPEFIKALENTDADVVLTPHHTINISNGEVKLALLSAAVWQNIHNGRGNVAVEKLRPQPYVPRHNLPYRFL